MLSWAEALSSPLLVLLYPGPETSLTTGAPGPGDGDLSLGRAFRLKFSVGIVWLRRGTHLPQFLAPAHPDLPVLA